MEPITRAEQIMSGESLEPITREEMFLAKAAGMDVETPAPITRREMFLSKISGGGGGTPVNNQDKTITQNGTYTADEGYTGLGNVTVNVASSGGSDDGSFKAVIERTATEITLPSDLTKIGDYAFYSYKTLALTELPAGVTSIGKLAFCGCTNLALTSLPDGVTSIGTSAFKECTQLALTSLPDSITSISTEAFRDCNKITLTEIPASVMSIDQYAFYSCDALKSITFKCTPTSISAGAFNSCTNITTINVPWAEGEVSGAPWGATNATINYNYVPQPPADKYSWDAVLASIDAGTYATDYAIGDTVPLDLGSEGVINMQIAAFDTDDLADGSGKAHITWLAKEMCMTIRRINPSPSTNDDGSYKEGTGCAGGWEKCELRAYLQNTIKSLIPEIVRNNIVPVTKYSYTTPVSGSAIKNYATTEDLWIPSCREVFGGTNCETSGPIYSSIYPDDTSRLKLCPGETFNMGWWMRSCNVSLGAYWRNVSTSGKTESSRTNQSQGIVIGFCT